MGVIQTFANGAADAVSLPAGQVGMPETIRTANERQRSRPRRGGILAAVISANLSIVVVTPARAAANALHGAIAIFDRQEIATLTLVAGLLCFAVLATVVLIRTRRAAGRFDASARDEVVALRADIDRFKQLLLAEPQVLVTWAAAADEPEILGDSSLIAPGAAPERVLAFGTWLEPAAAQRVEQAVATLRGDGRGFTMTLTTSAGRPIEAEGRAVGGRAVLRLRDVSGIERELVDLAARHDKLNADVETMKALLEFAAGAGMGARQSRPSDFRQ